MKDVSSVVVALIQGFVGLMIILGVWPVEAIAWVWVITAGLILFLLLLASIALVAKEAKR